MVFFGVHVCMFCVYCLDGRCVAQHRMFSCKRQQHLTLLQAAVMVSLGACVLSAPDNVAMRCVPHHVLCYSVSPCMVVRYCACNAALSVAGWTPGG